MSVYLMHTRAAGEPVLVTIDQVGGTSRSFSPMVNGCAVRFSMAGNGKMKDSATGSLWDAMTGECEAGAMQGKRLKLRSGGRTMVRSRRAGDGKRLAS